MSNSKLFVPHSISDSQEVAEDTNLHTTDTQTAVGGTSSHFLLQSPAEGVSSDPISGDQKSLVTKPQAAVKRKKKKKSQVKQSQAAEKYKEIIEWATFAHRRAVEQHKDYQFPGGILTAIEKYGSLTDEQYTTAQRLMSQDKSFHAPIVAEVMEAMRRQVDQDEINKAALAERIRCERLKYGLPEQEPDDVQPPQQPKKVVEYPDIMDCFFVVDTKPSLPDANTIELTPIPQCLVELFVDEQPRKRNNRYQDD